MWQNKNNKGTRSGINYKMFGMQNLVSQIQYILLSYSQVLHELTYDGMLQT